MKMYNSEVIFFFQTNIYAAYLHDAILLYAHALNESLTESVAITEGKNVSKSMIGKQFLGKQALHYLGHECTHTKES